MGEKQKEIQGEVYISLLLSPNVSNLASPKLSTDYSTEKYKAQMRESTRIFSEALKFRKPTDT